MKVALVTTTINVPTVLRLYRAYGPEVGIFVAGDMKTPDECLEIDGVYMTPTYQKALGYKCSELLGWNCIARRNIATLEALKWGADIIVMVDDDNIPMNEFYFADHVSALTKPYSGICVSGLEPWFDVGQLLDPIAPHRGFPYNKSTEWVADSVVDAKVGVNAGICMGDPDISAYFRMANHPAVHRASQLLDAGVIVNRERSWTVFNSQNTSFIRELAPAMFMMPGVGRYDDIYASLICQRVMMERGMHVKFGRPFVWQTRNDHDLMKDLQNETEGMNNIVDIVHWLSGGVNLAGTSGIDQVRSIYDKALSDDALPRHAAKAALAFLDDCEKVMK